MSTFVGNRCQWHRKSVEGCSNNRKNTYISYLVRKSQGQLDLHVVVSIFRLSKTVLLATWNVAHLVRNSLSVGSPLSGNSQSCRTSSEDRTGDTQGVHDGGWRTIGGLMLDMRSIEHLGFILLPAAIVTLGWRVFPGPVHVTVDHISV